MGSRDLLLVGFGGVWRVAQKADTGALSEILLHAEGWRQFKVSGYSHPEVDTIVYYTIVYYTIVYYTILYYILYYTILYYTILYYTILYYIILYYTILYYTILYYTVLCYMVFERTLIYSLYTSYSIYCRSVGLLQRRHRRPGSEALCRWVGSLSPRLS